MAPETLTPSETADVAITAFHNIVSALKGEEVDKALLQDSVELLGDIVQGFVDVEQARARVRADLAHNK